MTRQIAYNERPNRAGKGDSCSARAPSTPLYPNGLVPAVRRNSADFLEKKDIAQPTAAKVRAASLAGGTHHATQ
ncbi:MAG TPA: hypothetical protein VK550_03185 [Polyangiaceae bacterium]|nr:hypothetical protein [Polyangiaceae bacterium]